MIIFQRTNAVLAFLVIVGLLFINPLSYAQEDEEREKIEDKGYFLKVGEAGKERLDLINDLANPSSTAFLLKMGLKPGMDVLEIACGGGQMAAWLAEQVGAKGHVTAMDISEDQLKIARALSQPKNLENIEFTALSAYDIEKLAPKKFDVIFGRAIFIHLIDHLSVLKKAADLLKDEGIIVIQEAIFSHMFSAPESPAATEWRALSIRIFETSNKDHDIGIHLLEHYRNAGLDILDYEYHHPLLKTERERLHMYMMLIESKKYILEHNLASEESFNILAEKLKEEAKKVDTMVSFAPNVIIGGRKKAG